MKRRRRTICARCEGPRRGNAWKGHLPVCDDCKAKRGGKTRCPRRCGPGGLVGPRCRLYGPHDVSECRPQGEGLRLHVVHPEPVPAGAA